VTETKTRARMKVLATLMVLMFAAITTRLWFLQVLASQQFTRLASQNELRLVPIDPLRGQILDRNGHLLVGNRPATVVLVDRRGMNGHDDQVLFRLSNLLHVPVQDFLDRLGSVKYLPYQPVPVAEDVPQRAVFYIEEHHDLFPGVSYQIDPLRFYPGGSLGAHVLGYTGEISSKQLAEAAFSTYRPSELVGQSGVEAAYERYLHGANGIRGIQVDAQGHVLNDDYSTKPATAGDNVVLSIDQQIQDLSERSLSLGIQLARHTADRNSGQYLRATGGAVIVMDPRNGQILSLASNPTYDPSIFAGGLSHLEANQIFAAGNNNPLLDRATQGRYPAGSTFKPFIATEALKEGFITPNSRINCPAQWAVPTDPTHPFHNWKPQDYGAISIPEALTVSCDTVFYQLGYDFWLRYARLGKTTELMQNDLEEMGFGHLSGIDIPGEQAGLIPTAAYTRQVYKSNPKVYGKYYGWLPGDAVNLAIGQGYLQVTPLQMAEAYGAIANGGTLWEPRVGLEVRTPGGRVVRRIEPHALGRLPIPASKVAFLRKALTGVPLTGTAAAAFLGFPLDKIPVAGKTGTADILPKQPVSWFAAMAPADHPKYVVIAMVEQGGHGATTAAPIVRRILEGLFGLQTEKKLQAGQVAD